MKKLLLIVLCLTFLCSCSNNTDTPAEPVAEQTQAPQSSTEFTYDFEKLETDLKSLTYTSENDQEMKLFGEGALFWKIQSVYLHQTRK